jgi:hypothetical protein
MATARAYRELGEAAWSWVLGEIRGDDGPWLPDIVAPDEPSPGPGSDRDSLYAGIAGLAPVLAEIGRYRPLTDTEGALADGIVARLTAIVPTTVEANLYDGLAGYATALRLLAPGTEQVVLKRLDELATPAGWESTVDLGEETPGCPLTDIVMGTAGVVLTAAWAGGEHAERIMTVGGEALLRAAEPTDAGLDWRMFPGYRSSSPNFSHGTAGVASALAIAGVALRRPDFIEAAQRGARHLLSVGWLDDDGFVIPHTLPYSKREVEPVTYTWCHGPAGTSLAFAALRLAGVEAVGFEGEHDVAALRRRCLHSVLTSGVPQRLRPGFWDNDGRCCGTAGVGDVLLDAAQDTGDPALLDGARTMADALVERAIVDEAGARWRFIEHRQEEPLLPPRTSWMQGAAGIGAFLLRLARVEEDGLTAGVVVRPDQWWAVPASPRELAERPSTAVRIDQA